MTRYYGQIGFADEIETAPGVWREGITEHTYKGDLVRNIVNYGNGSEVNESMKMNQSISVVMDPYLETHIQTIRYITFMGSKWKVSSFQIERPRVIFQIGGQYNEQTP